MVLEQISKQLNLPVSDGQRIVFTKTISLVCLCNEFYLVAKPYHMTKLVAILDRYHLRHTETCYALVYIGIQWPDPDPESDLIAALKEILVRRGKKPWDNGI